METISIAIILARIDASAHSGQEFKIGFVSVKTNQYREMTIKKGFQNPDIPSTQKQGKSSSSSVINMKDNRILPVFDVGEGQPKNIKFDLIIEFNGKRVIH